MQQETPLRIQNALISVSDKRGIVPFARALKAAGVHILSTGGSARVLREAGIEVRDVAEVTGFPEIMEGRVKTLHPLIHGGILGRRDVDGEVMARHGIEAIDLVVVNLYPFQRVVAEPGCSREQAIENIDIGGPAMLRAAAKNHAWVTVVVDPDDYGEITEAIQRGSPALSLRRTLARKAFAHSARYDRAIAGYLASESPVKSLVESFDCEQLAELRYGENPHQRARLLGWPGGKPGASLARAIQHQGKPLSYNNLADADAAWGCVRGLSPAIACVIVKHANPCGVALGATALDAYQGALAGDPKSAFGGILAFNTVLDGSEVEAMMQQQFMEVLLARGYSASALAALADKPKLRVLSIEGEEARQGEVLKSIDGGLLVQDPDLQVDPEAPVAVTRRAPDEGEMVAMRFAWDVVRFAKSNAIVIADARHTLGIGAGQTSRVDSVELALAKAREQGFELRAAALASDAFFPFADGLELAAGAGIRAVIQPGGSIRDSEVIACADAHDMAMVCTGVRHFRH